MQEPKVDNVGDEVPQSKDGRTMWNRMCKNEKPKITN
jgi:hypothetical protein